MIMGYRQPWTGPPPGLSRPEPPPGAGPPPEEAGDEPFAALLPPQTAWTAPAEGEIETPATQPAAEELGAAALPTPMAAPQPVPLLPGLPPDGAPVGTTPPVGAPLGTTPPAGTTPAATPGQPPTPAATPAAAAPSAAPEVPAAPAAGMPSPAAPDLPGPTAPSRAQREELMRSGAATTTQAPAAPPSTPAAAQPAPAVPSAAHEGGGEPGQMHAQRDRAGREAAPDNVRTGKPAAQQSAPAQPAAPPQASASAGQAPGAAGAGPGSGLAPTPAAALEATIRIAHERGFSRARLTLKPAELGGVEVALRSSGSAVTATILVDTAEAARMLQDAGADLRRRLEASGVVLLALDVSVAEERPGEDRRGEAAGEDRAGAGDAPEPLPAAEGPGPAHTIALGGGVLIDVIA